MTALVSQTVLLRGGLNMTGPVVAVQDGYCLGCSNYEADIRGYTRFSGYERFDGRPKPSGIADSLDREDSRAAIGPVPGEGPVRGVWVLRGEKYAIRNAAGGASASLFKATNAGWQQVSLGETIKFKSGLKVIEDGEEITGQTSGAKATVHRAIVQDGTWAGGSGFMVIGLVSGTFADGETITSPLGGEAIIDGAIKAQTIAPGGRYDFETYNFRGSAGTSAMYGAGGTGPAFEFDGTVFTLIDTGVPDELNKPAHVGVLNNHLFLGFAGGSLQHSEIGNPLAWQAIGGAGELGFGDEFTDIKDAFNTTLMIFGRSRIGYLSGTSALNFSMEIITDEAGGVPHTAQSVGNMLYVDQLGLRDIASTQAFGNFKRSALSQSVEPLFDRSAARKPVGALRVRNRDLYRLFFSGGQVLSTYVGREVPEHMLLNLPIQFFCGCTQPDEDLYEITLVGAEDGFVYELDVGTSMDGQAVTAWMRLPYMHFGSPTINKCWYKATLQTSGPANATLSMAAEFDYGSGENPSAYDRSFDINSGGAFWTEGMWSQFLWSSQVIGQAEADLDGFGTNISPVIRTSGVDEPPHSLSDITYFYSRRGMQR